MKKLIGKDKSGRWTTAPSAAYPGKLCRRLAWLLASVLRKGAQEEPVAPVPASASEDTSASTVTGILPQKRSLSPLPKRSMSVGSDSVSVSVNKVDKSVATFREFQEACIAGNKAAQCWGQPIKVEWGGEVRELIDGFGLPSPNRWKPASRGGRLSVEARTLMDGFREDLRAFVDTNIGDVRKKSFELALGRLKGSPFPQEQLEGLRTKWASRLRDPEVAMFRSENQPFFLEMMSQALQVVGDPDWGSLCGDGDNFTNGVPVGYKVALKRTELVFAPKLKHRALDESSFKDEAGNYKSDPHVGHGLHGTLTPCQQLHPCFESVACHLSCLC